MFLMLLWDRRFSVPEFKEKDSRMAALVPGRKTA